MQNYHYEYNVSCRVFSLFGYLLPSDRKDLLGKLISNFWMFKLKYIWRDMVKHNQNFSSVRYAVLELHRLKGTKFQILVPP
uniref:Ovule protein n=1 Tax=Strongyloides venezuelensis TaxID=75913 RepID=A0A0K0F2M3_STRVS